MELQSGCSKKDKGTSPLSQLISKTSKSLANQPNQTFKSLSDLTSQHLNTSTKRIDSISGFEIPEMTFNKLKTPSKLNTSSFNSLDELTAHHFKDSNEKNVSSNFIIPKMDSKNLESVSSKTSFSFLADLAAHHLKISEEKKDAIKNFESPKFELSKNIGSSDPIIPEFSVKIKQEKFDDSFDNSQDSCNSLLGHISNLHLIETSIKKEVDIKVPLKINNTSCNNQIYDSTDNTVLTEIHLNCISDKWSNVSKLSKKASSFGKVLCKNYKRKKNDRKELIRLKERIQTVVHFDFSSPSPDSVILSRLNRKFF